MYCILNCMHTKYILNTNYVLLYTIVCILHTY